MSATIISKGNPFLEESKELMTIDVHNCVDQAVANTLHIMEDVGKAQYAQYVKDVLVERTVSIHQPIKRNHFQIFRQSNTKVKSKLKQQMKDIKSDYSLFSQLFITSQVRDDDLKVFFSHENHPWPPSLSNHGKLRVPSSKSQLLECLDARQPDSPTHFDVKVFDGAAEVHALPRSTASTFGDYRSGVFIEWTKHQLQTCKRIDVVWNIYIENSLKEATREKGTRRKVSPQVKLPVNFAEFLKDSRNKEELFALLTEDVAAYDYPADKEVYITSGQSVVSKGTSKPMPESDHEEADTRICLHVLDAFQKGAQIIMVSTVDTDVVVILVGIYFEIAEQHPDVQIWVAFGKGKHFRFYHINSICNELGKGKGRALPFFHAFTGSDTTLQFYGRAKKSSWDTWMIFPAVTESFLFPVQYPFTPITDESPYFKFIEQFTCNLYYNTTFVGSVNELRQDLFPRANDAKSSSNTICSDHAHKPEYLPS